MPRKKVKAVPGFQCSGFRELETFFGPPPVLEGEDVEDYRAIGQAIWDARPPEDFIQATRINDIAYLLWEGARLRRLKVRLIEASKIEGARSLIKRLDPTYRNDAFWSDWALGEEETVKYVDTLLTAAGLTREAIVAQTMETIVGTLETIERQSSQFEARRIVTMKEYDLYSDNAQRRREVAEERARQIIDVRPARAKAKKEQDCRLSRQLPLDLDAAE
jgi:hypothetical protein